MLSSVIWNGRIQYDIALQYSMLDDSVIHCTGGYGIVHTRLGYSMAYCGYNNYHGIVHSGVWLGIP